MKQSHKTILLWALVIVMVVAFYQLFSTPQQEERRLTTGQLLEQIRAGNVEDLEVKGQTYTGTLEDDDAQFVATGPEVDEGMRSLLDEKVQAWNMKEAEQGSIWLTLLVQGMPILFLFLLFFFFMRQLQSGGGKAMSFGKSRARLLTEHAKKVTFADVAGIEEAKEELEEIVSFLKDPKRFTRLGGRIPKGVLLMGQPGTGKTLLARAIAGEAGVPFFSISGSDFVEMFVGVGASRVRDLFEQGKKNAPCIVFIDEIDAVGRHRGAGLGGGHDEREQTLNQLLVEMDGFEANEGVILIAATNRPDVLDPALLRPGRFDRRIVVPPPDVRGRAGILKVHSRRVPLDPDADLEILARGTPGFSGADLENLVNEAALLAARRGRDKVTMTDLEAAKDKVIMGSERRSMIISEEQRRVTAVHEAGHTLVAKKLEHADPVHKVSIIPRGRALGVTLSLPEEDRLNASESWALDNISMAMGGRIAEELVFDSLTSGASNDIKQATSLARRMVTEWGMSRKLGPLDLAAGDQEVFLGRDMHQTVNYSEQTAIEIDAEVGRIVRDQYGRARAILEENKDALLRLADALLEYETLESEEIDLIIAGGEVKRKPTEPAANPPKSDADGSDKKKDKRKLIDALDGIGMPEPEKA